MQLSVGALVGGRFLVTALLASEGGTGLYRASDEKTRQPVVLRWIPPAPAARTAPAFLRRFDRLGPRLEKLKHRSLGSYVAHGRDADGSLYLASVLPDGELASTLLSKQPEWDLAGAMRILRDGSAGLSQLHSRGLVHGAVDPANLFVPREPGGACTLVLDVACVDLTDLAFVGEEQTLDGGPDSGSALNQPPPLPTPATDIVALGKIVLAWLFGEAALHDARPDRLLQKSTQTAKSDELQLLHSVLAAVFTSDASSRLADAAELRSFLEHSAPANPNDPTIDSSIVAAIGAGNQIEPTVAVPGAHSPSPIPVGEPGQPLIGTILEKRYVLESVLGRGGMGVVYRARHLVLGTPRAVKLVRNLQHRSTYVQRFLKEAQLASRVQHPNTVFLSDFGIGPDGQPFLVMELVGGRTLRQFLATDAVSVERACRIAVQIALGMQAIHEKDIVHRDLKPDNIFIIAQDGSRDFVKIADFGLAKELLPIDTPELPVAEEPEPGTPSPSPPSGHGLHSLPTPHLKVPLDTQSSASEKTAAGALVGTPRYMSPEQARGQPVDARADQYALGCILYELLTGTPPFTEPQLVKLLSLHMTAMPPPPRSKAPARGIPQSLSELTMRLLAKSPSGRFLSMREVAEALERELALLSQPMTAPPPPPVPRTRPGVVVAACAGVALLFTVAGGVVYQKRTTWLGDGKSELSQREAESLKQQSLRTIDEVLKGSDTEALVRDLSTLSDARNAEVAQRLVPLLQDPRMMVRAEAARVAGTTGERSLIEPLRGLLATREPAAVRLATAEALDLIGDADGTTALRAWMTHGSSIVAQVQAALRLCLRGDEGALRVLRLGLSTPTAGPTATEADSSSLPPVTRLKILSCLAGNGDAAARTLLQAQAAEAETVPQKLAAAVQLHELGDPAGAAALRREMATSGPYQLVAARLLASPSELEAVSLCRRVVEGGPAAASAMSLALLGLAAGGDQSDARRAALWQRRDAGSEVRIAAAVATLRLLTSAPALLDNESLRWAKLALSDPSWQVRIAAAEILGDVASSDALSVLATLSRDEVVAVRRAAVRALSAHPSQAALELLRERMRDSAAEVRWDALSTLGRLVTELRRLGNSRLAASGLELLREVAAQTEGTERALAAAALVRIGERTLDAALQATLKSAPGAIRRMVLDELQELPGWLGMALSDLDFDVRFAAAERLAERGDAQALPVLREAGGLGGWVSVVSNVLRVRLGDATASAVDARYAPAAPLLARLAVLSVLTGSADELAALTQAARDPAAEVRRLVAVRAAAVKGGAALLQLLRSDPDPVVRAQAQALLGRGAKEPPLLIHETRRRSVAQHLITQTEAETPKPSAPVPDAGSPVATPVPETKPKPAGPVETGFLKVEATPGILYRLDDGPWSLPSSAPLPLPVGPHRVTTVDTTQTVAIAAGVTSPLTLTATRGEQALGSVAMLIKQGKFLQARRSLETAEAQCKGGGKGLSKPGCRALLLSVAFQRAQLWEAQRLLPEAMNEYQQVIVPAAKADAVPTQRAAALQAASRLSKELGRVLSAERRGTRCVVDTFWVEPGRKTLVVRGVRQTVNVKAGETVGSGECG